MIRLEQLPAGHPGRRLLTGTTPWFAYQGDLRFSYRVYVPQGGEHLDTARVLVVVHGTARDTNGDWAAFAEQHDVVVVQPLFPVGIDGPDDIDAYKAIDSGSVRYDRVLFGMLDEVAGRWGVDIERFVLAGHSGGGQFALRMLLLHPQRLDGVVVSAPGRVTFVDAGSAWPLGTADAAARFGVEVDAAQIASVPVLLVVGAEDHGTEDLAAQGDASQDRFGATRRERLESLAQHLRDLGARPTVTVIPGVGHDQHDWEQHAQEFVSAGRDERPST
jgi:pimeloyl-ACP methyl ester carboxylesterase